MSHRLGRFLCRHDRLFFLHKGHEVIDEQCALVYRRRCRDERGDAGRYRAECSGVEGIVAYAVAAVKNSARDYCIAEAVCGAGDDRRQHEPEAFVHYQRFETGKILLEHLTVAVDKGIRKVEYAYLLCHVLVHEQIGIVIHLPAVLGAVTHILKILAAVIKVYRSRGEGDCHDEKRYPPHIRYARKYHEITDKGYERTYDGEGRLKRLYRARARLTVGVFELFVKAGHVERCKIERFCLLHYLYLDLLYDLLSGDADYRVRYPRDHTVYQTEGKKTDEQPEQHRADELQLERHAVCLGDRTFARQTLHFVGYARGYQRAYDRCYAVKDRNEQHGKQNERVCLPHEHEGIKQTVKETAEKLAQVARHVADIFGERHFFILISAASAGRGSESSGAHQDHHLSISRLHIFYHKIVAIATVSAKKVKKTVQYLVLRGDI